MAALIVLAAIADPIPPALQSRYIKLIAAFEKCDLKAYDAFYSKDYISVDPAGKTENRKEYMAGMNELMKGAKKAAIKIRYTGASTRKGVVDVSFDCTGKIISLIGTTTFHEIGTDSWKKVGKIWMEIKTVDKVFDVKSPKSIQK